MLDWTTILVALIGAVPATAAALVGIATLMSTRSTHRLFNSRMDELMKVTIKEQRAAAVTEERERVENEGQKP